MKELICITCPRGCHLIIDDNSNISGNFCPRGITYANSELTHPTRMVTTTVSINSFFDPRLPVKTSAPIAKELIFKVMNEISSVNVTPPIKIGDIIIKNVLGSGVDIIATKNILR